MRAVLLAAALALLAACASTAPRDAHAWLTRDNRARARVKAVLVVQGAQGAQDAHGGAASLMTAALLAWSWSTGPAPLVQLPDVDQLALARRAMQRSPADPAVAWVMLSLCMGRPGCDELAAATHFRTVDPMDAAGWLPDLQAADTRSPQAVDAVLGAMAQDTTFNLYYNRRVTAIADAYRRAATTPLSTRRPRPATLFGAAVSLARPHAPVLQALQTLSRACTDGARRAIRDDACNAILQAMARGDEAMIQALAAQLRIRRGAAGDPDRRAAQQWRRAWAWQRAQLRSVMWAPSVALVPLRSNRRFATELRLMATLPGEMQVMQAMLRRYGRAVEPPAGWQPSSRGG
jgi:hypothetical protein